MFLTAPQLLSTAGTGRWLRTNTAQLAIEPVSRNSRSVIRRYQQPPLGSPRQIENGVPPMSDWR
jgi:hypothetical protein